MNHIFENGSESFNMRVLLAVILSLSVVCWGGAAYGVTKTVKKDGSGDFTTIKSALNSNLSPGDTVLVYKGDYSNEGRLQLPAKLNGKKGAVITIKSKLIRAAITEGFSTRSKGTDELGNSYIRFEGFQIKNNTSGWIGGGVIIWGKGIEVVNNYFLEIPTAAIRGADRVVSEDILIKNNKIFKCNKGIYISGKRWRVEDNDIERLIYTNEDADYMRAFGKEHLIKGNYCHGTQLSEVGKSHTDGVQTYEINGGLHDSVIEGNIFHNYHQGFLCRSDEVGASNVIIRNNVYDNRGWTKKESRNEQGVVIGGGENIRVVNNLLIGHNSAIRFFQDTNGDGATGVIKNNIIIDSSAPISFSKKHTVAMGHNLIYKYRFIPDNAKSPTDIINKDPKLKSEINFIGPDKIPFTGDDGFRITEKSPAKDRGENLPSLVAYDIFNVKRNSSWDIGPMEYRTEGSKPKVTGIKIISIE